MLVMPPCKVTVSDLFIICIFRYMQRFDPGFGFSGGPYPMQPLFSPAVNYNTEFPQLGSGHRPQISIEQSLRPVPQQMRGGPWPVQSAPSPVGYGPPDGMMASFNPSRVGSHPGSSMYMHPSLYSFPLRPGISPVHPREHVQFFAQVDTLTYIIVYIPCNCLH